jgi:hypothetical protein
MLRKIEELDPHYQKQLVYLLRGDAAQNILLQLSFFLCAQHAMYGYAKSRLNFLVLSELLSS